VRRPRSTGLTPSMNWRRDIQQVGMMLLITPKVHHFRINIDVIVNARLTRWVSMIVRSWRIKLTSAVLGSFHSRSATLANSPVHDGNMPCRPTREESPSGAGPGRAPDSHRLHGRPTSAGSPTPPPSPTPPSSLLGVKIVRVLLRPTWANVAEGNLTFGRDPWRRRQVASCPGAGWRPIRDKGQVRRVSSAIC
jgi:hypothetical protein